MLKESEYPLSFFPVAGAPSGARSAGFRVGDKGTHTSRTIMFDELQQVLAAAPADAKRQDYAQAIIDGNCLSKPTASTRRLTNQRLGELYALDPTVPAFRVLRRLWDLQVEGRCLLALLISIARDPLLAATAPSIVFLPINSEFGRESMKSALQAVVGGRLSASTLDKVCRNAASSWAQSGHLEGRTFKRRRPVNASPIVVAFALYLSHAAGFRGAEIFLSAWLRVLDCDPSRARHLSLEAKRIGLIDLRMSGEVVEMNLSRLDPYLARS
ncbi:hypothetical protein AB9F47_23935 [Rhizobium leguminosarum]|uniref:hypothetical protein n=1 Tax=Rhizobium leguminosarum TaxID=384 RepID=UPI003F9A248D